MMTNGQLAVASFDDIVFDGRNKAYGAYRLRGLYNQHVTRALAIATVVFLLLVCFPIFSQWLAGRQDVDRIHTTGVVKLIDVVTPLPVTPVAPPPAVPPTQVPRQATIKHTRYTVTPDQQATEQVATQSELLAANNVGATTQTGSTDPTIEIPATVPANLPVTTPSTTEAPVTFAEHMPELTAGGGVAGIVAAIQKAVRYPREAVNNGIEGRIFVSFTVNTLGDVSDIKVVKGLGYGLDEEVVRAIKTLPKFIPGKQNGRDVSVAFTVPIAFQIR